MSNLTDQRSQLGGMIEYDPAKPFTPAIVPMIKTEADIVADFRQRASEIMKQFCLLMDEANKAGFRIQFQGIVFNPAMMRNEVIDLHLSKRY